MSIIIPIILAALFIGLFSPRMDKRAWLILGAFITFVIAYNYVKAS